MSPEPTSVLQKFRTVGIVEGISYLLLLGVAMPLKYVAGIPEAVKVVGWAHGVLFVAYCALLALAWRTLRWSFGKAVILFIASLIPFGTFVTDRRLKEEAQAA
ncbi:MAG: DUF3817 domain-containing protein [Myxococcota bacterium]